MNLFKNLYNYRELLKTSVKKEVRSKYKNSFLGVVWSFLNPLLQIMVYAIIFSLILKNKQEHYAVFLCAGIIPWTFFSVAINKSAFTIIENGNIIKKVYFPREIIPISVVVAEAINFLISTIIILGFVIIGGIGITKYLLFYPIILIAQYLVIISISFVVSSVCTYFRDLQHFIGIILQLLFYATPIVYSQESIPFEYQWILKLNPMTYIVNGYRSSVYGQEWFFEHFYSSTYFWIFVVVVFCIGSLIFKRSKTHFADVL
jgi:ABC-type polysaccharide/polyol phosphate export permease